MLLLLISLARHWTVYCFSHCNKTFVILALHVSIVHVSKTKTKWTPGGWAASQSLQILCGSDKQSTADGAVISCQGSPVSQRHLCSTKPAHHHIWETLRCLLKYRRWAKNDRSGIKVTTARARTSEFEQMRIEVRFKKCSTWREAFNINYTFWYISKSTHTASHVHITTKYPLPDFLKNNVKCV